MYKPPKTKKEEVIEKVHGKEIADPYRWLENDSARVEHWVREQNAYTNKTLENAIGRSKIKKELLKYLKLDWVGVPVPRKGYYFWQERKALENQPVIYFKKGLSGKKKVLFNPNKLNKKGLVTVDYWYPSPNGKYVALGLSEGGSELASIHVMDVRTGKRLKDVLPYARYSCV